jgi:hypothetical protein
VRNINTILNESKVNFELYSDFKIDSFRFYFPTDLLVNYDIPQKHIVIESEIVETFKNSAIQVEINRAKVYFSVKKYSIGDNAGENFNVLFSSKIRGQDYFKGIDKKSILLILLKLQEYNFIKFREDVTENELLNKCTVKDLDVCRDVYIPKLSFYDRNLKGTEAYVEYQKLRNLFSALKIRNFEKSKITDLAKGSKIYDKKGAFMLQINRREGSTIKSPFFKIYDKSIELTHHEKSFFESTFDLDVKNFIRNNIILREEYTLRNTRDFEKLGIANNLKTILNLDTSDFQRIYDTILDNLFQNKIIVKSDDVKESENDKLITTLLEIILRYESDRIKNTHLIINHIENIKSRATRLRYRTKINEILNQNTL